MKPPRCAVCHERFSPSNSLVRFSNYQPLPERTKGHPKGLEWFCEIHIEAAKALKSKTLAEAVAMIRVAELKDTESEGN